MFEINMVSLLGLIAAFCTTFAFVPQAIRIIKTRHTKDLSLGMYIIFSLGVFLWLIYGFMQMDFPIMLANFVTFIFSFTILMMKLKYKYSVFFDEHSRNSILVRRLSEMSQFAQLHSKRTFGN